MNLREKMDFLQGLEEAEFTELLLMPLLERLGYSEIRYHHGPREKGKDVVFLRNDPMRGDVFISAAVKCGKLTGSVSTNRGLREVLFQLKQSLQSTFTDRRTGREVPIREAWLINTFPISTEAIESVKEELNERASSLLIMDGPMLITKIDKCMPDIFTSLHSPEKRFLQSLKAKLHSSHSSRSFFGRGDTFFEDTYTAGTLAPVDRDVARYVSFARLLETDERSSINEVISTSKYAVICADVGAGKTSLLQKLALAIIEDNIDSMNPKEIPLFVPFHRLPLAAFRRGGLFAGIQEFLESEGVNIGAAKDVRLTLLLDGFDEIPVSDYTGEKDLEKLRNYFSSVVITARPTRLPDITDGYSYYLLRPFDEQDMRAFLSRWFVGPEGSDMAKAVFNHVANDPVLRVFCRTPLMLTLFAALAEQKNGTQSLPSRRTGIYEQISDLLLGRWDDERGVKNRYSFDIKSFLLERVALAAQMDQRRIVIMRDVYMVAEELLNSLGARGLGGNANSLVQEVFFRSSLFRDWAYTGEAEFSHLSFQEFYAAKRLMRTSDSDLLNSTLFDQWWRGVWTFFFGLKRTMDGLVIPRKSRVRRGEALGNFLLEADFTSIAKRQEVLRRIAEEIVRQPDLSEDSVDLYRPYGSDLIEVMLQEVKSSDFKGNSFNLILLSVSLGEEWVMKEILKKRGLFKSLSREQLEKLAPWTVGLLREPSGLPFFERICQITNSSGSFRSPSERITFLRTLATHLASLEEAIGRSSYRQASRTIFQYLHIIGHGDSKPYQDGWLRAWLSK